MKQHNLKILPNYFEEVIEKDELKRRTVEIRLNDRDYQVGDTLCLKEYIPSLTNEVTGREVNVIVTHIVDNILYVPEGYVAMSIHLVPHEINKM